MRSTRGRVDDRTTRAPLGEHIGVHRYVAWRPAFDPLPTAGTRNYWMSHNLSTLKDGLLDAVIAAFGKVPSQQCEIFFGAIGGATTRSAPDATAYAHRDAQFIMNVHGRWEDPADDTPGLFTASAPFASGGVYGNVLTADEPDRVRAAYGPNYDGLIQVKRKYDPDNPSRINQNISPA